MKEFVNIRGCESELYTNITHNTKASPSFLEVLVLVQKFYISFLQETCITSEKVHCKNIMSERILVLSVLSGYFK